MKMVFLDKIMEKAFGRDVYAKQSFENLME